MPDRDATYARLDAAFRDGDMATLRNELGSLDGYPNIVPDPAIGTCLVYAIYHSPIALVRDLLDAGADPNGSDGDGFPPLIAALSRTTPAPGAEPRTDDHELLELLLAHDADVGQRGINDFTPLHMAAMQGDMRAVDMLLEHDADANEITRIDDMETPLELAAHAGHRAVVDRLEPLTTRPDWERAAREGDVARLRRFLEAGYDIDAEDGYGLTALMRAAQAGQMDAVEYLIAEGADLDHTSKFHLSALLLAVIADQPRIARRLVQAGADATIVGSGLPAYDGKTAAELADEDGDKRLAGYIRTNSGTD